MASFEFIIFQCFFECSLLNHAVVNKVQCYVIYNCSSRTENLTDVKAIYHDT